MLSHVCRSDNLFFCSARQRYTSRHNKSTIDHHTPLDDSTTTRRRLDCGYRFDSTKCFTSGVFPRGSNNSSSLGRSDALMIATRTSSQCRAIQQYPGYAMLMVLTVLSPLALLTSRTIYIHRYTYIGRSVHTWYAPQKYMRLGWRRCERWTRRACGW
jgi:hypothetical protein